MTGDGEIFVLFTVLTEKLILNLPKGWGKVHIIIMGVLKTFYLVPEGVNLLLTEGADLLNGR